MPKNTQKDGLVTLEKIVLVVVLFLGLYGMAFAEGTFNYRRMADTEFYSDSTVNTTGVSLDITTAANTFTRTVTVINDDSTDTIYVDPNEQTVGNVTVADFNLGPGETFSFDIKIRYLGIKASANTPAYRVFATY